MRSIDKQILIVYIESMTVSIEIMNHGVLNLLSDMARLNLIRLNNPIKNDTESAKSLSSRFAGALSLSDTAYETFQNSLREGRNEWNRDIY